MFKLDNVLMLLTNLPAALMLVEEIKELIRQIIATFNEDDQAVLQAAIARLQEENDLMGAALNKSLGDESA
jgi:hypothetical protein